MQCKCNRDYIPDLYARATDNSFFVLLFPILLSCSVTPCFWNEPFVKKLKKFFSFRSLSSVSSFSSSSLVISRQCCWWYGKNCPRTVIHWLLCKSVSLTSIASRFSNPSEKIFNWLIMRFLPNVVHFWTPPFSFAARIGRFHSHLTNCFPEIKVVFVSCRFNDFCLMFPCIHWTPWDFALVSSA